MARHWRLLSLIGALLRRRPPAGSPRAVARQRLSAVLEVPLSPADPAPWWDRLVERLEADGELERRGEPEPPTRPSSLHPPPGSGL